MSESNWKLRLNNYVNNRICSLLHPKSRICFLIQFNLTQSLYWPHYISLTLKFLYFKPQAFLMEFTKYRISHLTFVVDSLTLSP